MRQLAFILAWLALAHPVQAGPNASAQAPRFGSRVSVTTPAALTPTITSFTPTSGPVLTSVTVSGTNFTGATTVTANGISASFTVVSASTITMTVPTAATTGPIAVTTSNGTGTSSANFTVTPSYYLSTTGSDSNSCATAKNINTPKLTLRSAVACVAAGEILYVRAGTYTGSGNQLNTAASTINNGTSWTNAVTIAAYPGEAPLIQPLTGGAAIDLNSSFPVSYVIFDHLIIDGSSVTVALYLGTSNHVRCRSCEFLNAQDSGVLAGGAGASFIELLQCKSHDNGGTSGGTSDPSLDHGLYWNVSDGLIDGCELYNNTGAGIQIYGDAGPSRNVLKNSYIHDNRHGYSGGAAVFVWGAGGSTAADNQLINNIITAQPGGYGIQVGSGLATGTLLYNNTVYQTDAIYIDTGSTGAVIKNNIAWHPTLGDPIHDSGTGTVQSNNRTTDPTFVNAGAGDFHLQASSGAIDAGVTLTLATDKDGVTRPVGAAWDIGAYER